MKLYRLTYLVLALTSLVVLSTSPPVRKIQLHSSLPLDQGDDLAKRVKEKQREAELRSQYLTVDFDEPDTSDAAKRAIQKVRKQRHNNAAIVSRNPSPKDREVASLPEGLFDFPALPMAESDLVVMADVVRGDAHMSEDKANVYTEFELRLWEIFKSSAVNLSQGQSITADRQGGYVRYPNKQTILYRVMKNGMPTMGSRYVFFLKATPESDVYNILTGYKIEANGISPLDLSPQFETYRGVEEASFVKAIRQAVSSSSQSPE